MQKYLVQDNLDLLYSKLSEDSREILIQLDKDLKETEKSCAYLHELDSKDVRIISKILLLQGYDITNTSSTIIINLY